MFVIVSVLRGEGGGATLCTASCTGKSRWRRLCNGKGHFSTSRVCSVSETAGVFSVCMCVCGSFTSLSDTLLSAVSKEPASG